MPAFCLGQGPGVPWCPGSPTAGVCLCVFGVRGRWSSAFNQSLWGPLPCPTEAPPLLNFHQARGPVIPGRPRRGGSAPSAGHCAESRVEMGPRLAVPWQGSRMLASDRTHFIDPKNKTIFCSQVEPGAGFGTSVSVSHIPHCDPEATVSNFLRSPIPSCS